MSEKYPGGFLTATAPAQNPALGGGTPGLWTLDQASYAAQTQSWAMYDPYWKNVTLLLNGENAANGAQNNTFLDSSTNNFTITRNGNTTQGTFSPYGNLWSNYFDGSGDYLYTASNTAFGMGTGDFTWEAWLFPISWPSAGNYSCILQIDGTGLYIGLNNSGFGLRQSGTANIISYGTNPTANTWTHVAIVRSGTTCTMYYNGVSVATATSSANFSAGNAWIGSDATPGNYYTGYASNMRLVKGTAVYTSNFTPSTTPLTAVSGTSLLTCQSNRFIDNSSNNFTLTVNGNTSVQRFSPFNPTAPYSTSTIGGSGYFDGTGDYLQVPSDAAFNFGTGEFTVEAWVNISTLNTDKSIIDFRSTTNSFGAFYISGSGNVLGFYDGSVTASGTALVAGAWYHVAYVRTGTTLYAYLNGVQQWSRALSTDITSTGAPEIGADFGGGASLMNGYISNLRVVKGTAVYTSNFTPPTAPLTAIANTALLCDFTNAGIPDAAMQNYLETVGNAQVSTSVAKYGTGSLAFDGTGDYLRSTSIALGTGDFTLEGWIYITNYSSFAPFVTVGDASLPTGFLLYVTSTGRIALEANGSPTIILGTTQTVPLNTWVNLTMVRYKSTTKLYVNGVNDGTLASDTYNYSGIVSVGAENYGGVYYTSLYGYIDDLRLTKGLARYTADFTPPTSSLQNL